MKKLLRHLTNAPVAVALAFLLVGAPSAPMANMMPSSGEALAYGCGGEMGIDGVGPPTPPDLDCDGLPDHDDPCPSDPMNTCNDRDGDGLDNNADPCPDDPSNMCHDWSMVPAHLTNAQCHELASDGRKLAKIIAAGAGVVILVSAPIGAIMGAVAGLMYLQGELRSALCELQP